MLLSSAALKHHLNIKVRKIKKILDSQIMGSHSNS
jgi:hypothetical protein